MTNNNHITAVLGGNGKTGRRVIQKLTALGVPVRVGSRSGTPPFDWDDPSSWGPAFAGVGSVYLTYQPDLGFPGAAARIEDAVTTAARAGVRRVVLLSGRNEDSVVPAEAAVTGSGLEWTVVRSSLFNQNFSEAFFVQPILDGTLYFPAGSVLEHFIDADDIAEVTSPPSPTTATSARSMSSPGPSSSPSATPSRRSPPTRVDESPTSPSRSTSSPRGSEPRASRRTKSPPLRRCSQPCSTGATPT